MADAADDGAGGDDDDVVDKARLASFTDNVVSIAITLLVLDVRVPPGLGQMQLGFALHALAPRLLGFVLSFAIVGVFWAAHHMLLRSFTHVSRAMLWVNNLFLLVISLVPASAGLLGEYPGSRASAVLYGANLLLVTGALAWLFHLAVRLHARRGVPLGAGQVRRGYRRPLIGAAIAAGGIGLAVVSPWASYAVYGLTPAGYILVQLLPLSRGQSGAGSGR